VPNDPVFRDRRNVASCKPEARARDGVPNDPVFPRWRFGPGWEAACFASVSVMVFWLTTACTAGDLSESPAAETANGRPTMRQLRTGTALPLPPSSRDLITGRSELRRRFREQLSHADTGAGATVAAETMLTAAATENDPSLKWAMLEEARRLGEAAGQADVVSRAIALAAASYEFDAIDLELRSLKQIPLRGLDARRAAGLASAAETVATRAEADQRPDQAAAAALLAYRAWQRAGNKTAAAQAAARHDAMLQGK
jgi:hypothetical protein